MKYPLYMYIMLTKNEIKQILKNNSDILKKYHVSKIGIFGSYVNGNATENSDVDLLVDFSDTISLFQYVHLSDSITGFLHRNVDLVELNGIKPQIKSKIMEQVEWIEGL